ncbi:MAG: hypothetical protein V8R15_04900 [Bacilli bacterium]
MREQLEIEKEKVTMNVILNIEVERIKNILAEYKNHILQYDELIVRTLIERIRVIPNKTLGLIIKGGIVSEQRQ